MLRLIGQYVSTRFHRLSDLGKYIDVYLSHQSQAHRKDGHMNQELEEGYIGSEAHKCENGVLLLQQPIWPNHC